MKLSLNKIILRTILLVVGLFPFGSPEIFACSCVGTEPPCAAFGSASAVFVGRAVSGAEQREGKDEKGNKIFYFVGKIHFAVEKAYSGDIGKEVDINSGTGGGDCGYWFESGETYVVYAYGNQKDGFSTGICTRTKKLSLAHEDLSFLQELPAKGSGVVIHGVVYQNVTYLGENQPPKYDGLADIQITAKDSQGKEFKTKTDDEGKYEFKGLKPGTYTVEATLPKHFQKGEYLSTRKLSIADRGCGIVGFAAVFDGRIIGVVLDSNDQPVAAKGKVVLISIEKGEKLRPMREGGSGYFSENGRFEIRQIKPGRYRLGININLNPDKDMPYPPVWHPGVPDESQATVIEIGPGQKLSDFTLKLPQKLTTRTVQGTVVWPNGKPAARASIYLESDKYPGRCVNGCSNADEQGRFTLVGFEGFKYFVQANADINPGVPGVAFKDRESIYAVPVPVELKEDESGLKVVLMLDKKTFEEQHKRKREQ